MRGRDHEVAVRRHIEVVHDGRRQPRAKGLPGAAVQARQNAWIESTTVRRAQEEREQRIYALVGPKDPARRYHVTPQHRVRVAELSAVLGLTNVQTIYLLNTICKEYAKSGNSMIASIVASDLEKMVTDREGGGRSLVRTILVDNGMGGIDD